MEPQLDVKEANVGLSDSTAGLGTEPLWGLHIEGPDDMHAAPSQVEARATAAVLNIMFERMPLTAKMGCRAVRLRCWWYGHEQHPQDSAPPESATCMYCGEYVPYGDMVGDTRHNRTMDWVRYWLFRRWWPTRCGDCGKRFGYHDGCIPF